MSDNIVIDVDSTSWEKFVEKSNKPVAVMFYSPTCPHCREMEPYFDTFAKEFIDKVVFVKLNIATNLDIASRYGVMGTPTFKFFCHGRPVHEIVGAVYPSLLKKSIEELLKYGDDCIKKSTSITHSITGYA